MSKASVKEIIKKFNDNPKKRAELLNELSANEISDLITVNNSSNTQGFAFNFYCSALTLITDEDKLFEIIEEVLPKLNRDELSLRELSDFYSRVCIELNKTSLDFVVKTAYLCYKCIASGDSRAIFYKDILPICLKLLSRNESKSVHYDSETKSCKEFRQDLINQILRKPTCITTITNLTSMFKDIELTPAQQTQLILKISENISQVSQGEIANLAYATFHITPYNQVLIPLLALDKYFNKRRYRFEFSELDTPSIDSIEEASTEGIVQVEETVIYHFQNYAEFTTLERDITNALKNLEYTPNLILSPFLSIILVSIAKISSSVQGNFRLNQSTILPFLKQVFKFNEEHRSLLRSSGWARTIDPIDAVNTEPLLRILKQNTCSLKQDLALNGLFGLSFLLLKTKSSNELNKFAIDFLNEIIKNRPEFTSDVMHIIVKMLFCEKNKGPIIECFSSFVQNRYLDIRASEPALKQLIENLTELDLETALSIESVIFTAITKSVDLRDLMIDIMKKAMYQRNSEETRKMAVMAFCVMLRKFTKKRSASSQAKFSHNISMLSLTQTQIAVNSTANKNIRQAEIIMLEILGLLRRCFSENREIKIMLYESLYNSILTTRDIIPYVVEFLDGHFRMYFESDENSSSNENEEDVDTIINFDKLFKSSNKPSNTDEQQQLLVMDDLGHLLKFIINCIHMTTEQHEKLNFDIEIYEKILKKLIEKCINASMDQLHVFTTLDNKNSIIVSQFLNCLEALMIFCWQRAKDDTEQISKIIMLFSKHQKIKEKTKKLLENSKKAQKSAKIELKMNCLWNLRDCSGFLKAIFSESSDTTNEMKQDKDFCKFVLDATCQKLESIESSSEYTKMKYSRTVSESFLYASKIMYQQLNVEVFEALHDNYSSDCAVSLIKAFNYAVNAMETSYGGKKEKWIRFLKLMSKNARNEDYDGMLMEVIDAIQKIIEWGFGAKQKDFVTSGSGTTILVSLFGVLEILYRKLENETNNRQCLNWILSFSKKTSIKHKVLSTTVIHLLMNCINQHENALLIDCIAHKIASCYKYRRSISEPENYAQNNLSLISKQSSSVDDAFLEFIEFVKSQINLVEIYIKRANSFNAYIRLEGKETRHETCSHLQQIETALCTKLVSLGKYIERLTSCNFPVTIKNIEKIVGMVNGYYKSIENLMKHFRKHYDVKNINFQCIGVEELIKYSKKFVVCIYGIAPYIETTADAEYNEGRDKKEGRTKKRDLILNKATKLIPRMIFLIETFNKSVNNFDTAAKTTFSRYLHAGEIRDFHIRNSVLFDAVESSQSIARSQSVDDDEATNTFVQQVSDNSEDEEQSVTKKSTRKRKQLLSESSSVSDTPSDDDDDGSKSVENEVIEDVGVDKALMAKERFESNVKLMAKKASRGGRKARGRKK